MIGHILASIALLTGTITDFKRREVPNWVTMGLVAAGLAIGIYTSVATESWMPLLSSLIGGAIGALIGGLMHYTGQWGGADFMLLTGMGTTFGVPLSLTPIPFFLIFLFVGIFAGALYGILYLFILVIVKRKVVFPVLKSRLEADSMPEVRTTAYIVLPILIILAAVWTNLLTLLLAIFGVFAYLTLILYHLTKTIEETCFIKEIAVEKLVPGDWVCVDVVKKKKIILKSEDLVTGLEPKHITLLKDEKIKTVTVKEGIPFVPSFLLAYVASIILHPSIEAFLLAIL